jgi:hypothetical protein
MPTRRNRCFLLQILLLAQHVSGTSKAASRKPDTHPSAPHHTDNLKTKAPNITGSNQLYNTLELLMMGIMVPETCWASSKICNKNHLLHLVGILFPHINEDARSKSLQIYTKCIELWRGPRKSHQYSAGQSHIMKIANKHFQNVKNVLIFWKDTTKSKLRAQRHKEKIKFGECLQAIPCRISVFPLVV